MSKLTFSQRWQIFLYWYCLGGRRIIRFCTYTKLIPFRFCEALKKIIYPKLLTNFEKKFYSQHGEDGILEEIFNRIGTTNKFCVEFGIENGDENNSLYFLKEKGFKGVWIEGYEPFFNKAKNIAQNLSVNLVKKFLTIENVITTFNETSIPTEFDFLSIDIDGNDYWILQEILKKFQPRVICLEYNAKYLPDQEFILPYNPTHVWNFSDLYGASLKSFNQLLEKSNYALVTCDSIGGNAFFVKRNLLKEKFVLSENPVSFFYNAPKYGTFFGHAPDYIITYKKHGS